MAAMMELVIMFICIAMVWWRWRICTRTCRRKRRMVVLRRWLQALYDCKEDYILTLNCVCGCCDRIIGSTLQRRSVRVRNSCRWISLCSVCVLSPPFVSHFGTSFYKTVSRKIQCRAGSVKPVSSSFQTVLTPVEVRKWMWMRPTGIVLPCERALR